MSSSIIIEIDAKAALARIQRFNAGSLATLTETVGALVKGQTQRRLISEKTSPDGKRWAPLAPLTVQARRNKSNSPLTDSNQMAGQITYVASLRQVIVGSNKGYAPYHQYGVESIKPKGKRALRIPFAGGGAAFAKETSIPARPFLGFSDKNLKEVRQAVEAWMEAQFG